jgi:hypothetical protein
VLDCIELSTDTEVMKADVIWMGLAVVAATATPVYAYVDPSSGGMLIQLLFGGVAGIAILIRLFWHRLKTRAGFKPDPAGSPADGVHAESARPDPDGPV